MLLDLKAACRELVKHRWFTCIVVFTLAISIGAWTTAIFGVVNRLMLNPLPLHAETVREIRAEYPDSDEREHSCAS
jgi:hypothetical protein